MCVTLGSKVEVIELKSVAHISSSISTVDIPRFYKLEIVFQFLLSVTYSVGASTIALLAYSYCAELGEVNVEAGCEGPGVPFGMLGGLLFILIQRFRISTKS